MLGSNVARPVGVTVSLVIAGISSERIGCWARAQRHRIVEGVGRSQVGSARAIAGTGCAGASKACRRVPRWRRWRRRCRCPRDRGVAGAAADADPHRGHLLLADRDRHHPTPVGEGEQRPAALVDREVAAQVGALARQPGHADVAEVALLVGLGDQKDVAGGALPAAGDGGQGRDPRGQFALHVGGPPADQVPVAHRAVKRPHRPALGGGGYHVCVPHQQQRRGLTRARDARHQVEPRRIGADQLALRSRRSQVCGQQLRRGCLVARWVRGVELDQGPGQPDNLFLQAALAHAPIVLGSPLTSPGTRRSRTSKRNGQSARSPGAGLRGRYSARPRSHARRAAAGRRPPAPAARRRRRPTRSRRRRHGRRPAPAARRPIDPPPPLPVGGAVAVGDEAAACQLPRPNQLGLARLREPGSGAMSS